MAALSSVRPRPSSWAGALLITGLLAGGCSAAGPASPPGGAEKATESRSTAAERPRLPAGTHRLTVRGQPSLLLVPERSNGRLVVYAHGAGQTVDQLLAVGDRGRSDLVAGLVEAGYTVAASDAHGDAWGNDISVADYQALVALAREETATSTVFLIGESMGGLPAARLTAPGVLDDVRALAGVYPVCDVSSMLTAFGPSIQAAGGSAPQALLDELSPVDLDGSVPLIAWASDQDTLVAKVRNAAVCAQQVREGGGTAVLVDTIGEHGDASNFRLDQIQAFFDAATED